MFYWQVRGMLRQLGLSGDHVEAVFCLHLGGGTGDTRSGQCVFITDRGSGKQQESIPRGIGIPGIVALTARSMHAYVYLCRLLQACDARLSLRAQLDHEDGEQYTTRLQWNPQGVTWEHMDSGYNTSMAGSTAKTMKSDLIIGNRLAPSVMSASSTSCRATTLCLCLLSAVVTTAAAVDVMTYKIARGHDRCALYLNACKEHSP
ncbi:hypothetical protein CBL_09531 [Carabus blaptoides fortunei]